MWPRINMSTNQTNDGNVGLPGMVDEGDFENKSREELIQMSLELPKFQWIHELIKLGCEVTKQGYLVYQSEIVAIFDPQPGLTLDHKLRWSLEMDTVYYTPYISDNPVGWFEIWKSKHIC